MGKVTKVIIEIDTTNDSFREDFYWEVSKVLSQVEMMDNQVLMDSNGNRTGIVKVETE